MRAGRKRLRRERDLNPRGGFTPPTRLAGERLRPLGHLSRLSTAAYRSRSPWPTSTGGGIYGPKRRHNPNSTAIRFATSRMTSSDVGARSDPVSASGPRFSWRPRLCDAPPGSTS